MKFLTTLCMVTMLATISFAQKKSQAIVLGQHAIDDSRYEEIEQSPYLFQEFAMGTAYNTSTGEKVEYLMNYNGYSKEFEFIHNDVKSEMDASHYDVIEINDYVASESYNKKFSAPTAKFVKGLDPRAPKLFSLVVYEDENLTAFKRFKVRVGKRQFNDPSQGMVTIQSFVPEFDYFVAQGKATTALSFNKKRVIQALDHDKVTDYVKKNKIKFQNEADLAKVISYYSELKAAEASTSAPIASAQN